MPRGGARKGAGRPKKTDIFKVAVATIKDEMPKDALAIVMASCPKGSNGLGMIQHVRDHDLTPPDLKLKLAVVAMPFETPKPIVDKSKPKKGEHEPEESDERLDARIADLLGKAGLGPRPGGTGAPPAPAKD